MRALRRRGCPVDYSLCNQTVTVYHWDGAATYTRTVIHGAFLDFKKTENGDKTGSSEVNSFLLVIPGQTVPWAVGDKVLLGEGPEVNSREGWGRADPCKGARSGSRAVCRSKILERRCSPYGSGWVMWRLLAV